MCNTQEDSYNKNKNNQINKYKNQNKDQNLNKINVLID